MQDMKDIDQVQGSMRRMYEKLGRSGQGRGYRLGADGELEEFGPPKPRRFRSTSETRELTAKDLEERRRARILRRVRMLDHTPGVARRRAHRETRNRIARESRRANRAA